MKLTYLLIVLLLILSSCGKVPTSEQEKNTSVVSEDSRVTSIISKKSMPSTEQNVLHYSPEYLAENEFGLSEEDFETAYEMCVRALTEYYKAVWNGSDIELDTFMENGNLKQYTHKKIQSQYDRYKNSANNSVRDITIGAWEMDYNEDVNGGFLYFKIPVEIKQSIGSYGEVTEFIVLNVNGRLVIADWYTGTKDSYDFMVRGENQTIDNPTIWNDK